MIHKIMCFSSLIIDSKFETPINESIALLFWCFLFYYWTEFIWSESQGSSSAKGTWI